MKKLVFAASLLAGATLWTGDVTGHGGTYRGPGDTVPPGVGGDGGGGVPGGGPMTGGTGPNGPGRGGPITGRGADGGPGGGPGSLTGGGAQGSDLDLWSFWWEFNKDRYLNLKSAIVRDDVTTGSDDYFLGQGQRGEAKDLFRPSRSQIDEIIVPALKAALANETNNDIVTGCMIALAKIGDEPSESRAESGIAALIRPFLASANQEIRETAAVALGILAHPSAVPLLVALMQDTAEGRAALKSTEVDARTRAFAAYGLALVAARSGDDADDLRQRIVAAFVDQLRRDRAASPDVSVAAMIGMGLARLDVDERPPEQRTPFAKDAPVTTREEQIDFCLAYLADRSKDRFVRAHAPTAIARLLADMTPAAAAGRRESVIEKLIACLDPRQSGQFEAEVRGSAAQALGLLVTRAAGKDQDGAPSVDARALDALMRWAEKDAQRQVQNFALISLGKIGARAGGAAGADDARRTIEGYLARRMAGGTGHAKHYSALAMGVQIHALENEAPTPAMLDAIGDGLRGAKTDDDVGALSIAAGMVGHDSYVPTLLKLLEITRDPDARGYVALGLGLARAAQAKEKIQTIVRESEYKPELLTQAAIALGLLGDKELVPELVDMLENASGLATQASISQALGFIGDRRSVDPLVAMLQDTTLTQTARGFAAVALGIVADKEPLPWNSKIGEDLNYRASTATLNDTNGTGILDIL